MTYTRFMSDTTEVINVRIPGRLVRKLQLWADEDRRSRSNLVAKIIAEAVEAHEAESDRPG